MGKKFTVTVYSDKDAVIAITYNNKVVGSLVLDKGANTIVVEARDYGATTFANIDYIKVYNEKYPTHYIAWGKQSDQGTSAPADGSTVTVLDVTTANSVSVDDDANLFETTETNNAPLALTNGGTITIAYSEGTTTGDGLIGGGTDDSITVTVGTTTWTFADADFTQSTVDIDGDGNADTVATATKTVYIAENATINGVAVGPGIHTIKIVAADLASDGTGEDSPDYMAFYIDDTLVDEKTDTANQVTSLSISLTVTDSTPKLVGAAFTGFDSISGGIFGETNDAWAGIRAITNFGIMVVQDNDNSLKDTTPTLNNGDIAIITIDVGNVFGGFQPRQKVTGKVIPEFGAPGVIEFTTPTSFNTNVITLQ
nr:hypothetical protein [Thermococcus nautili]